jgi:hypothetical protein
MDHLGDIDQLMVWLTQAFWLTKDWLFCAIIADVKDKSNVARRSFFLNIILILFKINSGYSAPVVN